jgi:endonuclease III
MSSPHHPGSQSNSDKAIEAEKKSAGDMDTSTSNMSEVPNAQSVNDKTKITQWLSGVSEGRVSRSKGVVKTSSNRLAKTKQHRLSSYLRSSKTSAAQVAEDMEEVNKHKATTIVSKRRSADNHSVITTRKEMVVDTESVIHPGAPAIKKRKLKHDDDGEDYVPKGSHTGAMGVDPAQGEWSTERPRRSARNSTFVSLRLSFRRPACSQDEPSYGQRALEDHSTEDGAGQKASPSGLHATPMGTRILILKVPNLQAVNILSRPARAGTLAATSEAQVKEADNDTSASSVQQTPEGEVQSATIKKQRFVVRKPSGGWDNDAYGWKWGLSPYGDFFARPSKEEAAVVFELLRSDLALRNVIVGDGERGEGVQRPAHGSGKGVTIDAIVRTILSQATNNESALYVQDILIENFPYAVDGQQVPGEVPNYHDVRLYSEKDLAALLQPAGFQNIRAEFILGFLNAIHRKNTMENPSWDGIDMGNSPNAPDFVPGHLSLAFLEDMSKEEIFNWLLSARGIGVKTAHCILDFNCGFPVCAVDTHVQFMSAALGWIPEGVSNRIHVAMHLDARLPDHLKHDLHQAFWNHRQHCGPCKRAGAPKEKKGGQQQNEGVDDERCVLEEMLQRRPNKPRSPRAKKVVAEEETVVKDVRKKSRVAYDAMSAEQAAERGYVEKELAINDDFKAGSVNQKKTKFWVPKK